VGLSYPPFLAGWIREPPQPAVPSLSTITCAAPPGGPSDLVVAMQHGSVVTLSWNAAPGAVAFYVVESGAAPGASTAPSREATSTTLRVTHIPPGTYYARVRARNACGVSPPSNEISVTVR
jgi:hypothetical protein